MHIPSMAQTPFQDLFYIRKKKNIFSKIFMVIQIFFQVLHVVNQCFFDEHLSLNKSFHHLVS